MKVAFTGGRNYADRKMVQFVVDLLQATYVRSFAVGDCPTGLDRMVREIIPATQVDVHRASWTLHGKAAGPVRNRAMLDDDVDVLVVFPGGKGTWDCVRQAREMGKAVVYAPDVEFETL